MWLRGHRAGDISVPYREMNYNLSPSSGNPKPPEKAPRTPVQIVKEQSKLYPKKLQELLEEDGPPTEVVPFTEYASNIHSKIAWCFCVCLFVILSLVLAFKLRLASFDPSWYYGPMFGFMLMLVVWRCAGVDSTPRSGRGVFSLAWFAAVAAMLGLTMDVFGLGADIFVVEHEGLGSVSELPALLSDKVPPTMFFFNDGYVAHELQVEHTHCVEKAGHYRKEYCVTYSMAPVFVNVSAAAPGHPGKVHAWAVPGTGKAVVFAGTSIPADHCTEEGGLTGVQFHMLFRPNSTNDFGELIEDFPHDLADRLRKDQELSDMARRMGGLCGESVQKQVDQSGNAEDHILLRVFREKYPEKDISGVVPAIRFQDPDTHMLVIRQTWLAGLILTTLAVLLTMIEIIVMCMEGNRFWYCPGRYRQNRQAGKESKKRKSSGATSSGSSTSGDSTASPSVLEMGSYDSDGSL
eukprot:TRINITY_DN8267_c0_g1_i1.p1 TRINITY_DN8267_c0_g1~~TRINITY_DN8267_c0_g1_i1.p1  ORF type:complete len:463 (-),score=79.29 TRINITY_DN8267_c0_g1_i1:159-1547(-)